MKRLAALLIICVAAGLFYSCDIYEFGPKHPKEKTWDKVLVFYMAGFNSLSESLMGDIDELKQGNLPAQGDNNAILIVGHHTAERLAYGIKTKPCIIRLYKDKKGKPVLDTLLRMDEGDLLTKKEVMTRSLDYIAEKFKSDHYGMILSSHGTGWLPAGYYSNPTGYTLAVGGNGLKAAPKTVFPSGPIPYVEPEVMPGPRTRTYGEEIVNDGGTRYVYEMDIKDLPEGLPFHFDYILMDICLMGCVEVAWELKDKCDYLGFSPAEILSDGLVYTNMTNRLLKSGNPDLKGVLDDYYDCYAAKSGDHQSACYTLVDCSKLDALATACKSAFETSRDAIAAVDPSKVQPFFRSYHHWFYDLKDILDKAGADTRAVENALRQCIAYSIHTKAFMPYSGGFTFDTYCGLSMYLPCNGSAYLDAYYQTLSWNKATSLVQ